MNIINNIKNTLKIAVLAIPLAGVGGSILSSCSDAWNEHYDQQDANGTMSLLQLVEENPQLSDFLRLLKSTHIYNNNRRTNVTYAELLDADQTLTVWAPINGTYNADSLLTLCQTERGDSTVALHFVRNHIAHNLYNMNGKTAESVKMLNDKYLTLTSTNLHNGAIMDGNYNKPATNGLLHVINDDAQYTYNIYEGLTSMSEFASIGQFLSGFERQELDEDKSIQAGIEDGKKVYSDSVIVKDNILFRTFDNIMSEDSNFVMMIPNTEVWNRVSSEAAKFFNYGSIEKADSISNYWTNISLLQDLIFNKNRQRSMVDSVFTTSFSSKQWPYHVYYNPYNAGGYLDKANIKDSLLCSNGWIYRIKEWPFTSEQIFFHPIYVEGEREANMISNNLCTTNIRQTNNSNISGGGYIDIVPKTSSSNWTASFEIRNTLSGTYDICVVVLPKTAYMANSKDTKPNKFTAVLHYVDEQGEKKTIDYKTELISKGNAIDTLTVGRFTFPVCNYMQQDATVSLDIKCTISNRETKYSREMFLDCIYLKPVSETSEAKNRKEARK